MTESEFEEFVITLGMQYYKPDSTAYGRIDGFETLLRFSQRQGRYIFQVGMGAEQKDNEQKLNTQLNQLASANNKILLARFENHALQVDMKMTVNSKIDRGTIKDSMGAVFGFCKDLKMLPFCKYCGQQKKTGFFTLGGVFDAMCNECFDIKSPVLDEKLKRRNQDSRFWRGFLGSILALLLGTVLYVCLYLLGVPWGFGSIILITAAMFGFMPFGKRHTRKSVVVCMIFSWLFLLAAEYVSYAAEFVRELSNADMDLFWASNEAIQWLNTHIFTPSVYGDMLLNIGVGTAWILLLGAVFALGYKAYCKPYIKSKKIA